MDAFHPPLTAVAGVLPPPELAFPRLTSAQIARIAVHGRRRAVTRGEVRVEAGDRTVPFFVVVSGELQVVRPTGAAETLIVTHHPGQFSGESNLISGSRTVGRTRVTESGEVIELDRQHLLAL